MRLPAKCTANKGYVNFSLRILTKVNYALHMSVIMFATIQKALVYVSM